MYVTCQDNKAGKPPFSHLPLAVLVRSAKAGPDALLDFILRVAVGDERLNPPAPFQSYLDDVVPLRSQGCYRITSIRELIIPGRFRRLEE